MAIRLDKDDIWFWYGKTQEFIKQNKSAVEFCKKQGLDVDTFYNRYNRIVNKSINNPSAYKEMLKVGHECIELNMGVSAYCKLSGLGLSCVHDIVLHIKYLEIIEELKKEKSSEMKFIQVPVIQHQDKLPQAPTIEPVIEPELIKKQNDVELIISAGVKVVVAPEVGADKLIKIIELLKDL